MEHILRTPHADVYIPEDLSLTEFVTRDLEKDADRIAVIDPISERQFTFGEVQAYIQNAAGALYQQGLRKGDVLCVCLPNVIEYPVVCHATFSLGAIVTTVNPLYTAGELAGQLADCDPKAIVTVPASTKTVNDACKIYGRTLKKYVIGDASRCPGYVSLSEMMTEKSPAPPAITINVREDICCLPYSSGTTGKPKGVMLTHQNIVSNISQIDHHHWQLAGYGDVLIGVVPFFHIYGICLVINMALLKRITIIVLERFDLEVYLKAIQKYKVTNLFIVPPLAVVLAKHPLVSKYDMTAVKKIFCGAAPLSRQQSFQLQERFKGVQRVDQGYGLTETSPVLTLTPPNGSFGSAGQVIGNTQLKVIDLETGVSLPALRHGEICGRGPQIMIGYLGNEEATKATIDTNGWLHTGDIGYYNHNGEIFIIDRLKELIKYKGFQVAPAELESLLLQHHQVADAAVIGQPDYLAGELPRAFIVLKEGGQETAEGIMQFVDSQVAPHKKLRGGVEFVKEIPKSASGKILRRLLKQQLQNKAKL